MADSRNVLIIGSEGSMGKRYQAILKYLEIPFSGVDINHSVGFVLNKVADASRVILCTPTDNHFSYLEKIIPIGKPILCEKPISRSLREMERILGLIEQHRSNFAMTFQYSELVPANQDPGQSHYHYFRSGKDGLIWDCLQIIALAKGEIEISNDSPVWRCMINGRKLSLSDMDHAYLNFTRKWLDGGIVQSPERLFEIHEKTEGLRHGNH